MSTICNTESKIIAFEGLNSVGKTKHIEATSIFLAKHNIPHIVSSEISEQKYHKRGQDMSDMFFRYEWTEKEEIMLISAIRSWHDKAVITPALSEGKHVLMDRFIYSTMAYQEHSELCELMKKHKLWHHDADIPIFLDGIRYPVEHRHGINIDYNLVRERFIKIIEKDEKKWLVYNNERDFENVQSDIERDLSERLGIIRNK